MKHAVQPRHAARPRHSAPRRFSRLVLSVAVIVALGAGSAMASTSHLNVLGIANGKELALNPGPGLVVQPATGCNPQESQGSLPIHIWCNVPTTTTVGPTTTLAPPTTSAPTTTRPAPTTTTTRATTTTTSSTTTTSVPVTPGSTPASDMPDSLFNKSAVGYPVDTNSSAYVSEVLSQATPTLSASDPIYVVGPGAQMANVTCGGCNGAGQVPVPSNYNPSSGSDKPIFIVDPSLNKVWEFWLFAQSSSGYTASWGGAATLSTFTGTFPNPYGESATGISYSATAISSADVAQGAIDHAIAVAVGSCAGQVFPADRNDCAGGGPPEGQMFRFSSSVNCSGFSGLAELVCNAGKTYGFVLTDKTGGPWVVLSAQEGVSGSLSGLPWSSLQAIDPPQA